MSHAGDTYDMGGGYYLYDTCGNDLLALGADDNQPIQDMEKAQRDIEAAASVAIDALGELETTTMQWMNEWMRLRAYQYCGGYMLSLIHI